MKLYKNLILLGASALALTACGAEDISSPGTGGNVTINNTTATTLPAPTTPAGVTPASGCPTIADAQGLKDDGTITGPTGTWRVCTLPARVKTSITLTKIPGLLYQLPGRVDVGTDGGFTKTSADTNVTLTIQPGVIIYGGTGVSWLAVNRGNKISAVGTATQPIIFTSRDNVLGLSTETSQGPWGGVVPLAVARSLTAPAVRRPAAPANARLKARLTRLCSAVPTMLTTAAVCPTSRSVIPATSLALTRNSSL